MSIDERNRYFQELSRNLRHEGLIVKPETEEGLLPVELDGQRLCLALDTGAVRYWKEDVADDHRSAVLNRVTDVAKITAEYDTVLAGHPSKYGVQFITWEWVQDHTALYQGNYYGPEGGTDSYAAAKRSFAVRSSLIPRSALFTPEQLTEVYRCIHETLESRYPITDERKKCLESAAEQIERGVPDLDERVGLSNDKELEFADEMFAQNSGIQFS